MEQPNCIKTITVSEFPLWKKAKETRTLLSLSIELTPRCNNNCVHCYINKPETDIRSIHGELSFAQWTHIIDEACDMGALWILFSGGEPLLREDFSDLYIYAKKKGMLVAVFTNGSLISPYHVKLFKSYPPRSLEISVYGVTQNVHRRVTRADLFDKTMSGIDLLKHGSIPFTLKIVAMKSNFNEITQIVEFCKINSDRPLRIDSFLNFRYDRDAKKNMLIQSERLNPEEFLAVDKLYKKKFDALRKKCQSVGLPGAHFDQPKTLIRCSAGKNSCCISYNGIFTLCSFLNTEDFSYDLKSGSLREAWINFAPKIRNKQSSTLEYSKNCGSCDIFNICPYCAGHALLETGAPEAYIQYYCLIGKERYRQFHS